MDIRRHAGLGTILAMICLLTVSFCGGGKVPAVTDYWVPGDPPPAQYKLDVALDLDQKLFKGTGTIVFKNSTERPIGVIALEWTPQTGSRTMDIGEKGSPLRFLNPERGLPASTPLFYALAEPVMPGAEVVLQVSFSATLPANESPVLTFQGNWHPRLWWDNIPVRNGYKVKFAPPAGYALAISGRLNESSGYYENENVTTSFGIFLSSALQTAETKSGEVLITALFTKEGEECARFCLEKAAGIIAVYKESLGYYPNRSLYILPGASRPMGGYPWASGIVVIHGQEVFKTMPPLHWEWITAHEVGHQYWGEYMMSGDAPYGYTDSWLMIGMGICTDHLYVRAKKLSEEKHQAFLKRYLDGVQKRVDTTEDTPASLRKQQRYDRNNILIHGKGFSILSALECALGREVFAEITAKILRDFGGRRLGYRQFWKICEEVSGENLDWFFEAWVRSSRYLCYQVVSQESQQEGGRYVSKVVVAPSTDSIRMPVPLKAVFEDGTSEMRRTDRFLNENTFTFESASKLKEVVLDPEGQLAMLKAPLPILPEELPDLIARLPWEGAGKEALKAYEAALGAQDMNPQIWYILGLKLVDGRYYAEALECMKKASEKAKNMSFLTWLGHLEDLLGNREKAIAYYREALRYDTTGTAGSHSQWGFSVNRPWVEQRLKTPFTLPIKEGEDTEPPAPVGLRELIDRVPYKGAGDDALKAFESARSSNLRDTDLWFSLGIKLFGAGYYAQALECMERFSPQGGSFLSLTWMGQLNDLLGNRKKALEYYREALTVAPEGTIMTHDDWGIKVDRAWVEERLKTPFALKSPNK